MATFFGEVVLVVSRAVDEDEEEYDSGTDDCKTFIRWTNDVQEYMKNLHQKRFDCSILVIAIGTAAVGFSDTYILRQNDELIGEIFTEQEHDVHKPQLQINVKDKACTLHRSSVDPRAFVCLCSTSVTVEQCFEWVNQLFNGFDVSDANIFVLNTLPTSCYSSEIPTSELPVPLLRCLRTSQFSERLHCPILEQPNLVTGLAAQVMTYCKVQEVKAVLYQCYTTSRTLVDAPTIKAFTPLLQSPLLKNITQMNPGADKRINKIAEQHHVYDTLYL